MKKHLIFTGLIFSIFCCFQSSAAGISDSLSKAKKKNVATLIDCKLIFGIPITTSDYDGNNILFTTVTIYQASQKYTTGAEFRNQPIGGGHAIYLTEVFTDIDRAKITPDAIDKIDFTISIHQGSGKQQVRAQVVLQFSDGNKIASGSPDPAPIIFIKTGASTPKDGSGGVYTYSTNKPFLNKAIIGEESFNKAILKEPVN